MPPPPPNFLPAGRRRRRLDPTRHLKSRELWNKVRFHASASAHGENGSAASTSNLQWAVALLRAVAYELQPFRIRPALARARIFVCEEEGLQHLSAACLERAKSAASTMQQLVEFVYQQLKQMDLETVKSSFVSNKSLLTKVTVGMLALKLYYRVLLYLHDLLHAGPIIIILTLLTLLYTIGLGDNTGAASGVPSAYSVFNRGMRRIMGTVDGEELARQYAGGAMAAGGMNNNNNNDVIEFDEGGVWVNEDDEGADNDEEERNLVNERRRQRRLERLQQRRNEEGGDDADGDDVQPLENEDTPQLNEEAQSDEHDDAAPDLLPANESRKSGKKARRRNLELRREMQRQRQAAAAMGFGAGGEADHAREMEARMALG